MVAYNHNTQCSLYCARICIDRRLRAQKIQESRQRGHEKNLLGKDCHDGGGGGCGGAGDVDFAATSRGWQGKSASGGGGDEDETDARPEGIPYSNYDVLITIYSMITYVLDLGSDFWVAYFHYVRAVEAGQVMINTDCLSI